MPWTWEIPSLWGSLPGSQAGPQEFPQRSQGDRHASCRRPEHTGSEDTTVLSGQSELSVLPGWNGPPVPRGRKPGSRDGRWHCVPVRVGLVPVLESSSRLQRWLMALKLPGGPGEPLQVAGATPWPFQPRPTLSGGPWPSHASCWGLCSRDTLLQGHSPETLLQGLSDRKINLKFGEASALAAATAGNVCAVLLAPWAGRSSVLRASRRLSRLPRSPGRPPFPLLPHLTVFSADFADSP